MKVELNLHVSQSTSTQDGCGKHMLVTILAQLGTYVYRFQRCTSCKSCKRLNV